MLNKFSKKAISPTLPLFILFHISSVSKQCFLNSRHQIHRPKVVFPPLLNFMSWSFGSCSSLDFYSSEEAFHFKYVQQLCSQWIDPAPSFCQLPWVIISSTFLPSKLFQFRVILYCYLLVIHTWQDINPGWTKLYKFTTELQICPSDQLTPALRSLKAIS